LDGDFAFRHSNCRAVRLIPLAGFRRPDFGTQLEAGRRNFRELHFAILSMIQHSNFDYDYEHETSQSIT
jgi:hypothetical protein